MFRPALLVTACLLATSAQADVEFDENVFINGPGGGTGDRLCVGDNCVNGEIYPNNTIKIRIKDDDTGIEFQDINSGDADWRIETNRSGGNNFVISSSGPGSTPFSIEPGGFGSLHINEFGAIGMGTTMPQEDLHMVAAGGPEIRMEDALSDQIWRIDAEFSSFAIADLTGQQAPFRIQAGAFGGSFEIAQNGRVGIGTSVPDGTLHTLGRGVQLMYFESVDNGPVQVRFRTDSENRRFLAVDGDDNVKTQIIFKDNEILFTGQTDSGANRWLTIGPSGIVSQGPTCSSPCDLTFDPDHFTVPPIAERAAYMWEHMHLPAIGPTSPDAPLNLTEKIGGLIHELEVAHIYIAEQDKALAVARARDAHHTAEIAQQAARLAALEAQMAKLLAQ